MLVILMVKDFLHSIEEQNRLSKWRNGYVFVTPKKYFNMKHAFTRNVIERCFEILKMCWAILRNPCFYLIKTQNRAIMA